MKEVDIDFLKILVEEYQDIKGRKILECLRKFDINHNTDCFEEACFKSVEEYCKEKVERKELITYEDILAILIRLSMMNFVLKKSSENLWYILLAGLLSEELQKARMSEVVKRLEDKFIEYMEILGEMKGEDAIRDIVLVFLFKDNADFMNTFLEGFPEFFEKLEKLWH
jgi:hypothetical protein